MPWWLVYYLRAVSLGTSYCWDTRRHYPAVPRDTRAAESVTCRVMDGEGFDGVKCGCVVGEINLVCRCGAGFRMYRFR